MAVNWGGIGPPIAIIIYSIIKEFVEWLRTPRLPRADQACRDITPKTWRDRLRFGRIKVWQKQRRVKKQF